MKIKLGSHVSFSSPEYLKKSIEDSIAFGSNTCMIFLGAPQNSKRISIEKYNLDFYLQNYQNIIKKEDIVVHAPYIINLANKAKKEFNIDFMVQEIERMNYLGSRLLVIHPGSKKDDTLENALDQCAFAISEIIKRTKDVIICIETMSGKGNEICSTLEEISYIVKKVNHDRLGICLDTCHLWDAGYNIKDDFEIFINQLKKLNLLEKIKVVHLNDSKNEINSHKDRHENIDQGFIGLKALKNILFSKDLEGIPFILETPWVENKPIYKKEIKLLLE
ncbi:MAG: deoxyribonuclease IV [Metamycoplasmataceae bacterium]